jgi:hypothetical protein
MLPSLAKSHDLIRYLILCRRVILKGAVTASAHLSSLFNSTRTAQDLHSTLAFSAEEAFDAGCSVAFVALRALPYKPVE